MSMMLEDTKPGYPLLPRLDDGRWRQAIVRPKRQDYTEVRDLPRQKANLITTVYNGDTIAIILEVRYQHWVAARVGYKVGWLNSANIDLTMPRWLNTEPIYHPEPATWYDEPDDHIPQELLTTELEALTDVIEHEPDVQLTKREVSRIIGYLKEIANTLRGARDRD